MTQLVQNLARREAALRRRAGDERVPAGPVGQIHQRSGQTRACGRSRGGLGRRIVDGRNNSENVDRHVDPAGDGGNLRRLHPAPVVAAVGEDHHRAAPPLAYPDALGGLRDRIVQRRRAKRDDRRHRFRQRLEIVRERHRFVEACVEGENGRLVAAIKPVEKMRGGFTRAGEVPFHAAADVEQQRHTDAGRVGTEIGNRSRPSGVEDFKISRREVAYKPAFVIPHNSRYAHNVDARFECGHRWLLLRQQFTCQSEDQTCHHRRDPVRSCHVRS
jgi:hypothetical protein